MAHICYPGQFKIPEFLARSRAILAGGIAVTGGAMKPADRMVELAWDRAVGRGGDNRDGEATIDVRYRIRAVDGNANQFTDSPQRARRARSEDALNRTKEEIEQIPELVVDAMLKVHRALGYEQVPWLTWRSLRLRGEFLASRRPRRTAASRERLREVAAQLGVRHLANLGGCPAQ